MQQFDFDNFDTRPTRRIAPAILSLGVVVIIGVAAGAVYLATRGQLDASRQTMSQTADETTTETGSSTSAAAEYKDGTYMATGSYMTPGGTESVTVTATLANGKVTSVNTTGSATGGNSAQYQSEFLANYESQVVGKSIDEISLSRVAGSSLTSAGFNTALAEIKRDALS